MIGLKSRSTVPLSFLFAFFYRIYFRVLLSETSGGEQQINRTADGRLVRTKNTQIIFLKEKTHQHVAFILTAL